MIFLSRNCLDVYRSQNRIMSNNESDRGWTCQYGRTVEWHWYHLDAELNPHFDNEHDMICTIKQQVYRRFQRAAMDRARIANVPISYQSASTMASFTPPSGRKNLKGKEVAGM